MDSCEVLPIECWQSIFNHLDDDGLEAVSLVCKDFLEILNICKESIEVFHPKVGMLSRLLKRFKHLKKINLRQYEGDLDEAISEIIRSDTSLDALGILNQHEFKPGWLKDLDSNSKMKDLKALNYTCSLCLSRTDLKLIANSFPNLEQLKFGNYKGDAIDFLASKLKLLKKIHMAGRSHISDPSLVALSQNCLFLKAVTICSTNHCVTENGIGLLLRNRPYLEALSLAYIKLDSSQSAITFENSISHAKALNSLKFHEMDVSDMLLSAIAKANLPLKKFGLNICSKFTVWGLLMVLSKNNLTWLRISEADFTDADMELLLSRYVGKLTYIDISGSYMKTSTLYLLFAKCPSLVEIIIDSPSSLDPLEDNNIALSKNHKIRNFHLRFLGMHDELVEKFALMFPNLRVLDLSYCKNVSSKGIEAILESCKFIRKLILMGYSKEKLIEDDTQFQEVYLEDLTLSSSQINDEGLVAIAKKCRRLVSLNLDYCNKITMEGLKHVIKNITTLRCLHIYTQLGSYIRGDHLLEWMLSSGNFASLKKIYLGPNYNFKDEKERDKFLEHGFLVL